MMKMLSAVIAAVIFLCGLFALLKWLYPTALTFIASPLVADGPSLFQLFQAIALSGAALATLWLTNRRTEAINRQAENAQRQAEAALRQIEINQQQQLRANERELQETFERALNMLSGEKNNAMSRLASFNMLEDVVNAYTEIFYNRAKKIIEYFIISETTEIRYSDSINANVGFAEKIKSIPRTNYDVYIAILAVCRIQKIENNNRVKINFSNAVFSKFNLETANLENASLSRSWYNSVRFIGCNLSGASLKNSQFVGCTFIDCNLSNASFSGKFENCKMIDCRVDGLSVETDNGWIFERNKHAADSPPKVPPDIWPLYQEDIANAQENEFRYGNSNEAIPAFVIIDEEEGEASTG